MGLYKETVVMPKKSIISNKYWKRLEEEKDKQIQEKGFYRKANWSDDFKGSNKSAPKILEEEEESEQTRRDTPKD